ncbi:MAG: DUF3137 domain-containing protein [Clostridiales bacterium]|jgi:hypothetical protein|nr:DUF3137 domain-containing protein [Clostridiales bacterium]
MALVFWFIIVPVVVLGLIGILIKVVIPSLFRKAAGAVKGTLDRKFEKEYLTDPVSDRKAQRKMSTTFWSCWVMLVLGIIMVVTPIVKIIQAGEMYLTDFLPYLLLGAFGVGLFILGLVTKRRSKQLSALVAEPIIRDVFGADCELDAFGHIPNECIAASGFVDGYENVSGSDFVRGSYRGVSVMFSDVRLTKTEIKYDHSTQKSHEYVIELFKGNWLVADFDRELAEHPLTVQEKRSGSNAIQMESEAFNRQFSVFCPDAHTAFYILTPHFMERLVAVDAAADGSSHFKFAKNRLQIAIGTKRDIFEAETFKTPNVGAMRERFRQELGRLTAVLDEMLAHERLFGSDAERQEPSRERELSHD